MPAPTGTEVLRIRLLKLYEGGSLAVTTETVGSLVRDWASEIHGSATTENVLKGIRALRSTFPAFMARHDPAAVLSAALKAA